MTFLGFQYQTCFSDAFNDCSDVFDQLLRSVCGNPNVVDVLICFDDFIPRMKLENADKALLSPWASLRYANALLDESN